MARAISKILFILGLYNFLAYLECVRSYAWSKGHSDPDLSSVISILSKKEEERSIIILNIKNCKQKPKRFSIGFFSLQVSMETFHFGITRTRKNRRELKYVLLSTQNTNQSLKQIILAQIQLLKPP